MHPGKYTYILIVAGTALLTALLAASCYVYQFGFHLSDDHSRWAEFGDYLGGILNPTFGFIALLVLLYTVYLQTRELQLSTKGTSEFRFRPSRTEPGASTTKLRKELSSK